MTVSSTGRELFGIEQQSWGLKGLFHDAHVLKSHNVDILGHEINLVALFLLQSTNETSKLVQVPAVSPFSSSTVGIDR